MAMSTSSSEQRRAASGHNKPAQRTRLSQMQLRSVSQGLLGKLFLRLGIARPRTIRGRVTEAQRNLVLTGLVLGFLSLFTAIFPPCGLPIAIAGLLIGWHARRSTPLHVMASWSIALSVCGLLLTLMYGAFSIGFYITHLFR